MLGYAQATAQASSLGPWGWIAFAAAGLAIALSTVSSIKSATEGYASGGIVTSHGGSGAYTDGLTAHVTAGEMVINSYQQSRLWRIISGQESAQYQTMGSGNVEFKIRGQELYGVLKNYNKLQNKVGRDIGIK